jgi:predicted DNA-binding transcriptional regulator AlpA
MQNERIMRRPEVESDTGLRCSTLYELMDKGEFPKNIPIHGRSKGWIFSEVQRWIAERVEEGKRLRAEAEEEEVRKQLQMEAEAEEQGKATEKHDEEEEAEDTSA